MDIYDDARISVGWMLWAAVMAWWPARKGKTVKGDRCELAKDSLTVKSVFSLEHKDDEMPNSRTYLSWMGLDPFIES